MVFTDRNLMNKRLDRGETGWKEVMACLNNESMAMNGL